MGDRAAKNPMFDRLSAVAKAFGSGRRAELVDVLAQGERSVEELAGEIEQSVANTSHHLQVLSRGGIVSTRRDGTRVIYRLASDRVGDLWEAMRDVAGRHLSGLDDLVDAYLGERSELAIISRDELARRLGDDDLLVLDVRPAAEYEAGHIPSAELVAPGSVIDRVADLPGHVEVVAYCRGPYCAFAVDAVRQLNNRGRKARRLEDGFPEWRRDGLPVE